MTHRARAFSSDEGRMRPKRRQILAPIVAIAAASILLAPAAPCGATSPAEGPRSGPRLILLPDRSVPMVSCVVIVPAGSAFESPQTNGAAHYLEHLLFNGTATRTREEIYAQTDFLGAYNNASTQRERTVFQLLLPSENWKEGLRLQADMILRSTLPPAMFEKEKGIILEELARDRTDAGYEWESFVAQQLWGNDARAMPVLGTERTITEMNLDALLEFYAKTYRGGAKTIVLMGDFDPEEAAREIESAYGKPIASGNTAATAAGEAATPPGETAANPRTARPAFPPGRTVVSKSMLALAKTRVRIMLPMPSIEDAGAADAILLADLLAEGRHAAVSRAVEAACGTAAECSATFEGGVPWSTLSIDADFPSDARGGEAPDSQVPAVGAILEHLAALAASNDWLTDVEDVRVARVVRETQLREKMHYFALERADLLSAGDTRLALDLPAAVGACEPESVRRLMREAARGAFVAVAAGPSLVEAREPIVATDWPETVAPPAASSPPARHTIPDPPRTPVSEIRRIVRPDSLELIVHSTPDPRTLAIHAFLRDRAGWEDAAGVPQGTADVLHRMMELGTASRTKDELRGALGAIGATLKVTDADGIPYDDYYFSPEFSYVRLETIDAFAPEAMALFGEILTTPRIDETARAAATAAAGARARKDAESPGAVADRLFYRTLNEHHPRARAVDGPPGSVDSVDLDDVKRLHEVIAQSSNVILVVSSSLPVERIEALVTEAFPLRPAKEIEGARSGKSLEFVPAKLDRRVEALAETGREQSAIVVGTPVEVPAQDLPALRVAVALLSERLADRLREQEGLAYSIGASARLDAPGPCVTMSAGTRPENLARMEAGMREVAKALGEDAPTREQILGAVNRTEGQMRMRRLTRIGQAFALGMAELRGHDPSQIDAEPAKLRSVTPEDVMRVARRSLAFDPSITAIAR